MLSTTLRHDTFDLVNTVIHEITHSTYFPKGQAVFNESFASFVGALWSTASARCSAPSVRGMPSASH
ncbi:MAG: aminopeptidase [Gemmatimonadaceae bacterium]